LLDDLGPDVVSRWWHIRWSSHVYFHTSKQDTTSWSWSRPHSKLL
jgi:hypothetical protein